MTSVRKTRVLTLFAIHRFPPAERRLFELHAQQSRSLYLYQGHVIKDSYAIVYTHFVFVCTVRALKRTHL